MNVNPSCRRMWMLAGFAAVFLIGDLFLAFLKSGSDMDSGGYLIGIAGFALTISGDALSLMARFRKCRPRMDLQAHLACHSRRALH